MNTRESKMKVSGSQTRSVWECPPSAVVLLRRTGGGLPALTGCGKLHDDPQSARGLAHSRTWRTVVTFCLLLAALCFQAQGQYSIDWYTIDGGGGTSTGGVYSVTGTIGQPDAGTMVGDSYTLQGGFWGIIAVVLTPGAPLITILHTTTNTVAVIWPSPSTGWTLQQNTNSVSSGNWSNVTSAILDDGTTKALIVNPPTGNRFYRLYQP